jgi:hypothetical protein
VSTIVISKIPGKLLNDFTLERDLPHDLKDRCERRVHKSGEQRRVGRRRGTPSRDERSQQF